MKLITILFLLFSPLANAIDGIITVLEAPLFKVPDEKSKVIQYVRKGATIYIHGQEAFRDKYSDEKFFMQEGQKLDPDSDPLIGDGQIYYPEAGSAFYKTISKSGGEAYILKEHVLVNYKDKREITQKVIDFDHTDYRLEEPLPDGYPLLKDSGYKGQFYLGLGQPNYKAYPFKETIIDSSVDLIKEVNFIWSRAEDIDKRRRFFFGAMGGIYFSQMNYLLTTQKAEQSNFRLYIGPYASYDTYRTKKHALNLYTSIQFVLIDKMDVNIKSNATKFSEKRTYENSLNISPNLGANFQFFKNLFYFDTIIGFNARGLLPRTYTTEEKGTQSTFWQSTAKGDSLDQPFRTELTYYIGIQSYY